MLDLNEQQFKSERYSPPYGHRPSRGGQPRGKLLQFFMGGGNSRIKRLTVSLMVVFLICSGLVAQQNQLGGSLSLDTNSNRNKQGSITKNGLHLAKEDISLDTDSPIWVELESPANATLGFQTIQYINLEHRYNRDDSILLQSIVTGLSPVKFAGVGVDDLTDRGITPISNDLALKAPQIACFRSHANLWSKMVQENWSTMLVLEADATWDVNVKEIMRRVSAAMNEFSKTSPSAKFRGTASENDPYIHDNWDMISLGHCFDGQEFYQDHLVYKDLDAQANQNFFGRRLNNERILRRAASPACTTAYALSQKGARKLLLRNALDYNMPVDLTISDLVSSGQLLAYSTHPVVFGQLAFKDGIGAEDQNSDIDLLESVGTEDYEEYKEKWKQVHRDRNIWDMSKIYQGCQFKKPAFKAINEHIFGDTPSNPEGTLWWPDKGNDAVSVVETVVEVVNGGEPTTLPSATSGNGNANGSTEAST